MMLKALQKAVLFAVLSCLVFAVSVQADTRQIEPYHKYKVIIIGAGAAGLAATHDLYIHGVHDILVIEARNRIGGRVWTIHPWGVATDMGASWIHWIDNMNPLAELAKIYNINTSPTIYSLANPVNKFSSFDLYDNDGRKITAQEMKATLALIDKFQENLSQKKIHLKQDSSFADAGNWFARQEHLQGNALRLFNFLAKDMIESDAAADLNQVSLSASMAMHNAGISVQNSLIGKDTLPQGGYIRLFSKLVKDIPISLNNPVIAINYHDKDVTILSKKGTYHAQYVIVTLPLGVLQAGTVKFSPELPKAKLASIKRLRMGFLNKIYLLFDKSFWDAKVEWISMMPNSIKPNAYYEALNLYKFFKQPILLFFSAGSFAEETEKWSDEKIVNDIMHSLKLIYGNRAHEPSAYLITRWGKDQFARGSYSYPNIGSSIEDYKILSMPVANKLFFAGEATSVTDPGTVHGAYMSGISAADLILQKIKMGTIEHDNKKIA